MEELKLWQVIKQLETCRDNGAGPDAKVQVITSDGTYAFLKVIAVGPRGGLTVTLMAAKEEEMQHA